MITSPMTVFPQNTTIDANKKNIFSMEIKTAGEVVNKYDIKIFENTDDSISFQRENQIPLDENNQPIDIYNGDFLNISIPSDSLQNSLDYRWQVTLYGNQINMLIATGVIVKNSTTNTNLIIRQHPNLEPNMYIQIKNEKRKIITYNFETGEIALEKAFSFSVQKGFQYQILSDFIYTPEYFFKARKTPSIYFKDISADSIKINNRKYTFEAIYSSEDSNVKYFIFDLFDFEGEKIDSSGEVYSSRIIYNFNGFQRLKNYILRLTVKNQDDVEIIRELKIEVDYKDFTTRKRPVVEFLEKEGGARISWAALAPIEGEYVTIGPTNLTYEKDTPFPDAYSVVLPKNSQIVYDGKKGANVNFKDESTIISSVQLSALKQGDIISVEDDSGNIFSISYDGYSFYYNDSREPGQKYKIRELLRESSCLVDQASPEDNVGYMLYEDDFWAENDTQYYLVTNTEPVLKKQFQISLNIDDKTLNTVEEVNI